MGLYFVGTPDGGGGGLESTPTYNLSDIAKNNHDVCDPLNFG